MTLGERIAQIRKQAGLSQEQLGDRLGVSRQAVSKWESDQTNPDVAYLAQMCRELEVSADWLLLGEDRDSVPQHCPCCQAVVTGLEKFCPNCGRNLRGKSDGYTIFLKGITPVSVSSAAADLVRLSNSGLFPDGSPLSKSLTWDEAEALDISAPVVLGRGLSQEQAYQAWNTIMSPYRFLFFQDTGEEDPQVLAEYPGLDSRELAAGLPKEPMSFGAMVLAVIVGIVGAILLLSIL